MGISCVNLKPVCNASLDTALIPRQSGWGGFPVAAKRLDGFPVGEGVFARVPFRVAEGRGKADKSMVLLGPDDAAPVSIPVGAAFAAMYLLHTTNKGDVGRKPALYTFHYADGSTAERAVAIGEDVADWLFPREGPNCRIGWTGYHKDNEFQKCVYVAEIVNPYPAKKVQAVELRRLERYGQYALLGMTLSTEAPFFRKAARGDRAGLANHIHLDSDILRAAGGGLKIAASLYNKDGRPIRGAQLSAVIDGKRYGFQKDGEGFSLAVGRQKSWRRYANAVRIEARSGGRLVARRDAVFYAEGRPRLLAPPHDRRPPQFIVVAFDDCKGLPGLEAMLGIVEGLLAKGVRAPLTMYAAPCPPRGADLDKQILLYQRMYDLGCEFCNHTLNHNPGGVNWFALPRAGQVQEIDGCRQWFRDNIHGLWHVYSQKSGGGGAKGFRDPVFTRDLIRSQQFEYNANNVTASYDTNLPHPDVQFWPYKLGPEWAIEIGMIDGDAPPVHRPITKGFFTDYSGKFDYETRDGVEMLAANFDYRYRSPHRPPMILNAFHEWGLGQYWDSHRNERAILDGFLTEVLVRRRKKYPDAHVVTFHQLIEYMRRDDLDAIVAEGSGQGKKG